MPSSSRRRAPPHRAHRACWGHRAKWGHRARGRAGAEPTAPDGGDAFGAGRPLRGVPPTPKKSGRSAPKASTPRRSRAVPPLFPSPPRVRRTGERASWLRGTTRTRVRALGGCATSARPWPRGCLPRGRPRSPGPALAWQRPGASGWPAAARVRYRRDSPRANPARRLAGRPSCAARSPCLPAGCRRGRGTSASERAASGAAP